jgi:hypothetical protein
MTNPKLQIPNKFQAPIPNDPKRFCLEFCFLKIEIYLGFDVWNLVLRTLSQIKSLLP